MLRSCLLLPALSLLAAAAPAGAPVVPSRLPRGDEQHTMRVHMLDVGQGTAVLVEFPCAAMLIDTGAESNDEFDGVEALRKQLEAFFKRRADLRRTLALLVLTHPHIDHVRGLPVVLREFTVRNVVDNGQRGDDIVKDEMAVLRRFLDAHPQVGHFSVVDAAFPGSAGLSNAVVDPVACGAVDPRIRVLAGQYTANPGWPEPPDGPGPMHNENNHSVVLRVDFGAASLLSTGDAEKPALRTLVNRYDGTALLDADIQVVGHHGSYNATTRELLDASTPQVALIPTGPPWRQQPWSAYQYGHPRTTAVTRYERSTLLRRPPEEVLVASGTRRFTRVTLERAIYATGWDGAVTVSANDSGDIAVDYARRHGR